MGHRLGHERRGLRPDHRHPPGHRHGRALGLPLALLPLRRHHGGHGPPPLSQGPPARRAADQGSLERPAGRHRLPEHAPPPGGGVGGHRLLHDVPGRLHLRGLPPHLAGAGPGRHGQPDRPHVPGGRHRQRRHRPPGGEAVGPDRPEGNHPAGVRGAVGGDGAHAGAGDQPLDRLPHVLPHHGAGGHAGESLHRPPHGAGEG